MNEIVTAGILVIGDEILSGRTKDKNIGFIAEYLTNIGIDLKEVRVVADDEADIIAALDALRSRYTYVFTTGGIGPTHDDITAAIEREKELKKWRREWKINLIEQDNPNWEDLYEAIAR